MIDANNAPRNAESLDEELQHAAKELHTNSSLAPMCTEIT
jgi:hypothetical protein